MNDAADQTTASVTIDDLKETLRKFREMPDFVIEIRCCAEMIDAIRQLCEATPRPDCPIDSICGVRIVEKNLWPMDVWEEIYRSGASELRSGGGMLIARREASDTPTDTP
jgi:hypothetical protein